MKNRIVKQMIESITGAKFESLIEPKQMKNGKHYKVKGSYKLRYRGMPYTTRMKHTIVSEYNNSQGLEELFRKGLLSGGTNNAN